MKASIIIVAVIAVLLGVAYLMGWFPWSRTSPPSASTSSTNPMSTPSPGTTPTPTPSPSLSSPSGGRIIFDFAITDITGSGLSRTITAQLTNEGSVDAHNVWAEVTVSSSALRIKVNDQTSLRIDVGTLPAGQTVTKRLTLSFSITDGLKITQNGATFKMTVHSDELTETFSYDYNP